MDIKLSYEEVKANHPDLVRTLVEKIRSSNAKDKDRDESDFEWYYSYGVAVRGMSFGEMIGSLGQKRQPEEPKSTQEKIASQLNSVMGLSLTISAGRVRRYVALSDKPKLFVDKFSEIYMKAEEDKQKEQDRISKLTPEERQREIQENFNTLHGMGGFFGFNVGPNGVNQIQPQKINYNVDDILDKISRVGMEGLTAGEKKFLEENSK